MSKHSGVTLRECLALINADNRGRFISFAKVKTFLASSSNFIKYKHFSHSAFPPLEQNPSLATGQLLIANASKRGRWLLASSPGGSDAPPTFKKKSAEAFP